MGILSSGSATSIQSAPGCRSTKSCIRAQQFFYFRTLGKFTDVDHRHATRCQRFCGCLGIAPAATKYGLLRIGHSTLIQRRNTVGGALQFTSSRLEHVMTAGFCVARPFVEVIASSGICDCSLCSLPTTCTRSRIPAWLGNWYQARFANFLERQPEAWIRRENVTSSGSSEMLPRQWWIAWRMSPTTQSDFALWRLPQQFDHRLNNVLVLVDQDVLKLVRQLSVRTRSLRIASAGFDIKSTKSTALRLARSSSCNFVEGCHIFAAVLELIICRLQLGDSLSVFRWRYEFLL